MKLEVTKIGKGIKGIDGRVYDIDGKALIEDIKAKGLDIPLFINHKRGEAFGFIKPDDFKVEGDTLVCECELNDAGTAALDKKSYRYISPAFIMGKDGEVVGLEHVSLTNVPNLSKTALNEQQQIVSVNMRDEVVDGHLGELKAACEALNKRCDDIMSIINTPKIEENTGDNTVLNEVQTGFNTNLLERVYQLELNAQRALPKHKEAILAAKNEAELNAALVYAEAEAKVLFTEEILNPSNKIEENDAEASLTLI